MHSIRRSCHSALQSPNNLCIFANGSRRAFSRSTAHQRGTLPVFLSPSTPELSTLLLDLNSKVLLPQHLTRDQEKLVYQQENRAKIESEPIEITLGELTLPLQHLDRNRDIPGRWHQLREIVRHSKTQQDWENVVRVMEGYENAGIHITGARKAMVVRKLSEAGMQHLILKALQRPKVTGLRLKGWVVVSQVLRAAHDKAAKADWAQADTQKALSFAEQVVELMEDKEHQGQHLGGEDDLRSDPKVIALPLELAAELAYRHDGDAEKVKKYANRLMNALKQNDFASSDMQRLTVLAAKRDFKKITDQAAALNNLARTMYSVIPLWNGLSTARTVLDKEMPMEEDAERVQAKLYDALQAGTEALEALRLRNGKEIGSKDGYAALVKDAIRRCEDAGE